MPDLHWQFTALLTKQQRRSHCRREIYLNAQVNLISFEDCQTQAKTSHVMQYTKAIGIEGAGVRADTITNCAIGTITILAVQRSSDNKGQSDQQ